MNKTEDYTEAYRCVICRVIICYSKYIFPPDGLLCSKCEWNSHLYACVHCGKMTYGSSNKEVICSDCWRNLHQ